MSFRVQEMKENIRTFFVLARWDAAASQWRGHRSDGGESFGPTLDACAQLATQYSSRAKAERALEDYMWDYAWHAMTGD
jgi:hypothetical protein